MHQATIAEQAKILECETGRSLTDCLHRWKEFLGPIDPRGKRVLDIGCGTGVHSVFLAAFAGAREVIGIDPSEGEGSPTDAYEVAKRLRGQMGLENVTFLKEDFQATSIPGEFDLAVAVGVLHHMHETERDGRYDAGVKCEMQPTFCRMHNALKPGGWLVIVEGFRQNVTQIARRFGIRGPGFLKMMQWNTKQMPEVWMSLCRDANLQNISFDYYVPHCLRRLRPLLRNRVGNYLTTSTYVIRAQRSAEKQPS